MVHLLRYQARAKLGNWGRLWIWRKCRKGPRICQAIGWSPGLSLGLIKEKLFCVWSILFWITDILDWSIIFLGFLGSKISAFFAQATFIYVSILLYMIICSASAFINWLLFCYIIQIKFVTYHLHPYINFSPHSHFGSMIHSIWIVITSNLSTSSEVCTVQYINAGRTIL